MRTPVFTLFLLAIPFASNAIDDSAFVDRMEFNKQGERMVVRASTQQDFNGGTVVVEQRLKAIGGDSFLYEFDQQSELTKAYHAAYCEAVGMGPDETGESIFTGASSAWVCIRSSGGSSQPFQ